MMKVHTNVVKILNWFGRLAIGKARNPPGIKELAFRLVS